MKIYGVIMAGGGGTRFWPLSRKQTPKQLLNLSGKEIMVNEAIDRLARVCSYEDIFVVTNKTQTARSNMYTKKPYSCRTRRAQYGRVSMLRRNGNREKIRRRNNGRYSFRRIYKK